MEFSNYYFPVLINIDNSGQRMRMMSYLPQSDVTDICPYCLGKYQWSSSCIICSKVMILKL